MAFLVRLACLACLAAALVAPATRTLRPPSRKMLFGGGKKSGGALSNVAGVMDQFKQAQDIAKKSQEMQQELAGAEFEGANADGTVTFVMNGQQQPVSAAAPGFDGLDAAALATGYQDAIKDAQAKSLAAMNEKMAALYESVGLGGAMPGGM